MNNEVKVQTIRAYSKDCMGCIRHKTDVMIAYTTEDGDNITDLFLTQAQAMALIMELMGAVSRNKL